MESGPRSAILVLCEILGQTAGSFISDRDLGRGYQSVIGHGVMPITLSRMVRKSDPCRGLVMRSAIIFSVGQYTSLMIPLTRRSCNQKYPMRMCRESSDVGLPFSKSLTVDWLSWSTVMGNLGYPCSSIKYELQRLCCMPLDRATNSASHEDVVFSFWAVDLL